MTMKTYKVKFGRVMYRDGAGLHVIPAPQTAELPPDVAERNRFQLELVSNGHNGDNQPHDDDDLSDLGIPEGANVRHGEENSPTLETDMEKDEETPDTVEEGEGEERDVTQEMDVHNTQMGKNDQHDGQQKKNSAQTRKTRTRRTG